MSAGCSQIIYQLFDPAIYYITITALIQNIKKQPGFLLPAGLLYILYIDHSIILYRKVTHCPLVQFLFTPNVPSL